MKDEMIRPGPCEHAAKSVGTQFPLLFENKPARWTLGENDAQERLVKHTAMAESATVSLPPPRSTNDTSRNSSVISASDSRDAARLSLAWIPRL